MKIIKGLVIKINSNKTFTVIVKKYIKKNFYKKFLIKSKKYKIHDEYNLINLNDIIFFKISKPISKTKFSFLLKILN